MMPAIGSRGYSQFVVTIPTDRERGIGEYGRGRDQEQRSEAELGTFIYTCLFLYVIDWIGVRCM